MVKKQAQVKNRDIFTLANIMGPGVVLPRLHRVNRGAPPSTDQHPIRMGTSCTRSTSHGARGAVYGGEARAKMDQKNAHSCHVQRRDDHEAPAPEPVDQPLGFANVGVGVCGVRWRRRCWRRRR